MKLLEESRTIVHRSRDWSNQHCMPSTQVPRMIKPSRCTKCKDWWLKCEDHIRRDVSSSSCQMIGSNHAYKCQVTNWTTDIIKLKYKEQKWRTKKKYIPKYEFCKHIHGSEENDTFMNLKNPSVCGAECSPHHRAETTLDMRYRWTAAATIDREEMLR